MTTGPYGRDPLEPWRRQQEQLRRALQGPFHDMVRQQETINRALRGPLEHVERVQKTLRAATQKPVLDAIERQRAFDQALRGPMQAIAQNQENLRRILEGPFEAMRRNQEAINRALAAPYGGILTQQRAFLDGLAAAVDAGAIDPADFELDDSDDPSSTWLRTFSLALKTAALSRAQVEVLLNHVSLLLALVSIAIASAGGDEDLAELMGYASVLCAACALLLWYSRR